MIQVELVKGFTINPDEGNPAGIVTDSFDLSSEKMNSIARDIGFSATAFLYPENDSTIPIRFFSPKGESAICVHALLGAAERVFSRNNLTQSYTFRGINNDFKVRKTLDGKFMVDLPSPHFGPTTEYRLAVSQALRCNPEAIDKSLPIRVVSTGKPKIFVSLKSLDNLLTLSPDDDLMKKLCINFKAEGVLPFFRSESGNELYARHWNPLTLDKEDPICGVGSGALAAHLFAEKLFAGGELCIEMGQALNLPGKVYVQFSDRSVEVGGFATKFGERFI